MYVANLAKQMESKDSNQTNFIMVIEQFMEIEQLMDSSVSCSIANESISTQIINGSVNKMMSSQIFIVINPLFVSNPYQCDQSIDWIIPLVFLG